MDPTMQLMASIVLVAVFFDFTNGFHDAGNSVAMMVATRALSPRNAIAIAVSFNVVGALFAEAVAKTIGTGLLDPAVATVEVALAAICGAAVWNLVTWYMSVPASSSLALVGGLIGAGIVVAGPAAVDWQTVGVKVAGPAILAPLLGASCALLAYALLVRAPFRGSSSAVSRKRFQRLQTVVGAWLSFEHGANDAMKTMGVVGLAMMAQSGSDTFELPWWAVTLAIVTLALGTLTGGWRIIRTMAERITRVDAAQGCAASIGGATALAVATRYGMPVSTSYTVVGSIMGAGSAKRPSSVRWYVLSDIAVALTLTVPSAAIMGAVCMLLVQITPLAALPIIAAMGWYALRVVRTEGQDPVQRAQDDARLDAVDPAASWAGTARIPRPRLGQVVETP